MNSFSFFLADTAVCIRRVLWDLKSAGDLKSVRFAAPRDPQVTGDFHERNGELYNH